MWKCHKCGKPVYFAERKQSLGYDWHPECLRCEECGKRLDPGQHAEHKGVPYCHVPCYGALFGPQLFGHGTRVESHKSFGQKGSPKVGSGPPLPRSHLESKLKVFNQFFDGRSAEIKSREVNGRLVLEGALRIYWGVQGVIHLKEDDDQRTVTIRKRNSCRFSNGVEVDDESEPENENENDSLTSDTGIDSGSESIESNSCAQSPVIEQNCSSIDTTKCLTLPPKLDVRSLEWDELDDLLQVERRIDESEKLYQTMPGSMPSQSESNKADIVHNNADIVHNNVDSVHNKVDNFHNNESEQCAQRTKLAQDDSWIEKGLLLNRSMSGPDCLERIRTSEPSDCEDSSVDSISLSESVTSDSGKNDTSSEVVLRRAAKTGSAAIRRRPGKRRSRTKLKRRCSINGHFYNRETSFFTPPHGSQTSVWVTSLVNTHEVINLMLEKYKVDSRPEQFAMFVVRDNGDTSSEVVLRRAAKTGSAAIRRRPGKRRSRTKLKRRCSINGHFYNRETSFFTPPHGSQTSVWVTSLVNTHEVINLMLEKYKVDSRPEQFAMFVVRDNGDTSSEVVLRRAAKTGSAAIRRRPGKRRSRTKLKRRCSINGHFYNRETSFFTPPHGSQTSVWVTSLVNTHEVINLMLEKYKVDSRPEQFAMFVVRDNGEQRRLRDDEYPLLVRVLLGPHEDVVKLFIMDRKSTLEVSNEVAQFLNLSLAECRAILEQYRAEEEREVGRVQEKYKEMRKRIKQRMEHLKVRL